MFLEFFAVKQNKMNKIVVNSGAQTDVGCDRENNEDSFLCADDKKLWLVADGMGGHDCGEVASDLAKNAILDNYAEIATLEESIHKAHQTIKDAASKGIGKEGMGTTVVVLVVERDNYKISWVGDSRAYLIDGDGFRQISKDHSYVQKLVDMGKITKEEAEFFPNKNVITQALGTDNGEDIVVDSVEGKIVGGERFLLCSDGLSDAVNDVGIEELVKEIASPEDLAQELINKALENKGGDNITAVVVDFSKSTDEYLVDDENHSKGSSGEEGNSDIEHTKLNLAIAFGVIGLLVIFYLLVFG